MPALLTIASQVMCPHGGQVILVTANSKVMAAGAPVVLASDQHMVAGCGFTIGPKPSPCLTVTWSLGATKAGAGGAPLTQASIGICHSPEGAPQGVAIIVNTQPQVEAL